MILYLIFFIWHLLSSSCESFHKIFKNILSFIITFTLNHMKSLLECSSVSELTNAQSALHKKWSFPFKDFFSNRDQIWSFLRIWSNLLKKSFFHTVLCYLKDWKKVPLLVLKEALWISFSSKDCSERHTGGEKVPAVIENVVALKYVF